MSHNICISFEREKQFLEFVWHPQKTGQEWLKYSTTLNVLILKLYFLKHTILHTDQSKWEKGNEGHPTADLPAGPADENTA